MIFNNNKINVRSAIMSLLSDVLFATLSVTGLIASIATSHFLASVMESIYPTGWHAYDLAFIGTATCIYILPYVRLRSARLLQIPRFITYLITQCMTLHVWLISRTLNVKSAIPVPGTTDQDPKTSICLQKPYPTVKVKLPYKLKASQI